MKKRKQLIAITNDMTAKEKAAVSHIHNGEYEQAIAVLRELTLLAQKGRELKEEIQREDIKFSDVSDLRLVQPARKSVQNMLVNEVAGTEKFEKLLNEEMGAKSPYEMRNSNNEWRNDESKTVTIIDVQKRDIPDRVAEMKKADDIPKGEFINQDTGIGIQFGKRSLREVIAKAMPDAKRNISVEARMAALYKMQDIIENAICFDSQISEANSTSKSPNTLFIHRLYGVYKYDNEMYLANLAIEEFYNKTLETEVEKTASRVYSFRDIKITPIEALRLNPDADLQNASQDTSTSVTIITIPQLYDLVKTYDQNFFENPNSEGRADREVEIKLHNDFIDAVKTMNKELGGDSSDLCKKDGADFYETIRSMSEWSDKVQKISEKEKDKSKSSDDFSL